MVAVTLASDPMLHMDDKDKKKFIDIPCLH